MGNGPTPLSVRNSDNNLNVSKNGTYNYYLVYLGSLAVVLQYEFVIFVGLGKTERQLKASK